MIDAATIRSLLGEVRTREAAGIELLRTLVNLDTPSRDKRLVDRAMTVVADACTQRGARVSTVRQEELGDHLRADWGDWGDGVDGVDGGRPRTLILAHLDTVFPEGEAERRPFAERDGWLTGPGVLDMKAGLVQALVAIDVIRNRLGAAPVTLLVTSDEEIGSPTSRALIEATARDADAVFVAEPAAGTAVKTARAGVGMFTVTAEGRASHAGLAPADGRSAIVEMAHQVIAMSGLGDPAQGTTVNVGLIRGGSARNVVPAECTVEVDVRVRNRDEADRVAAALRALRPVDRDVQLHVTGGINRPPMERTTGTATLFDRAAAIAKELDEPLGEASVGGGSDGNFTAALSVATLDGLGAVGSGAHTLDERVERARFAPRAALLATLVLAGQDGVAI